MSNKLHLFNKHLFKLFNKELPSLNHTEENHNMNKFHSKENTSIMNKSQKLNTSQSKDNTLTMKLFKELNKSQSPDNTLTIKSLNTKPNMFLKFPILMSLIMSHNKNHTLNKSQFKKPTLNTFQKLDIPLNMFHNKDKLKMLNTFQLLNK